MANRWATVADEGLQRAVVEVGRRVEFPAMAGLAHAVTRRLEEQPASRRAAWSARLADAAARWRPDRISVLRPVIRPAWQPVAVTLLILVAMVSGTLAFSPTARRAVAGWLGLRGVRIDVVPTTPTAPVRTLGEGLFLGERVTLEEARAVAGFAPRLPRLAELGPPDEVYAGRSFGGQVTLLWRARPGLPAAAETGVGLLVTQFRGVVEEDLVHKAVGPATTVEFVRVGGEPGYWIEGAPHEVLFTDEFGNVRGDTVRLAGNVLLWEQGELTLRLEAAVSRERALAIAESVRSSG